MEPILQSPFLSSLLKTWKFVTTYHDYLDLPETFADVSLYEFDKHVQNEKYKTSFIAEMIEALVKKISGGEKYKKQQTTAHYLAKQNKFNLFQDLVKTSAYELGLTQVSFSMNWRNLNLISTQKAFQELSVKEKYTYLSMLVDHITTHSSFKKTYMQSLKAQYTEATQAQGRVMLEVQKKFVPKMTNSFVIGKDSDGKCYFYLSKIGDSILEYDCKTKQWRRIQGRQNIKKEIVEKLLNKQDSISEEQVELCEQISQLWNRLGWSINDTAFNRTNKLFDIKQEAPRPDKMNLIKEKFHQLDHEYTKFISDCFNFRWATKQRRIQYHKETDQAETFNDLVICFSKFFHETRHGAQKKVKTLEFYDYNLETDDVKPDQFKHTFLRSNYLYSRGVISQHPGAKKYSESLYHHIKGFLEDTQKFSSYLYEYLAIFIETMIAIIKQLYPAQYNKRLRQIQRLQEQIKTKKLQQEERNKGKKSKLVKMNQKKNVMSENSQSESNDEENSSNDQSQSETTVEKNKQSSNIAGRRLRQKVKINYKITNSNSRSKMIVTKKNQPLIHNAPTRSQKLRSNGGNGNNNKKGKMQIGSDSESNEYEDEVSLSVSETSQKSGGLNLDKYKYDDSSKQQNMRRSLRSVSKSKEK